MTRKEFLQLSALALATPIFGTTSKKPMPTLFISHGSPMNMILDNSYTRALKKLHSTLPRPKAIVVISAHWYQEKIYISGSDPQETIYDFYGFPDELYEMEYAPKGSPTLAKELHEKIFNSEIVDRGVDHGTWAVLHHIYPNQDIPTLQIAINKNLSYLEHYKLGQLLGYLRDNGVLVIASGNVTHNLRAVKWEDNAPIDNWAVEFDEFIKESFENRDFYPLVDAKNNPNFAKAHPFDDHFIPLLYTAGMVRGDESITTLHESMQHGNLSMRCIQVG